MCSQNGPDHLILILIPAVHLHNKHPNSDGSPINSSQDSKFSTFHVQKEDINVGNTIFLENACHTLAGNSDKRPVLSFVNFSKCEALMSCVVPPVAG